MTVDEILEYMLASVPDEYDASAGSFFYDLLYPVAEQIYIQKNKISTLSENSFALTASDEYLDRKTAEQSVERKPATYSQGMLKITGNRGEVVSEGSKVAADTVLFAFSCFLKFFSKSFTNRHKCSTIISPPLPRILSSLSKNR